MNIFYEIDKITSQIRIPMLKTIMDLGIIPNTYIRNLNNPLLSMHQDTARHLLIVENTTNISQSEINQSKFPDVDVVYISKYQLKNILEIIHTFKIKWKTINILFHGTVTDDSNIDIFNVKMSMNRNLFNADPNVTGLTDLMYGISNFATESLFVYTCSVGVTDGLKELCLNVSKRTLLEKGIFLSTNDTGNQSPADWIIEWSTNRGYLNDDNDNNEMHHAEINLFKNIEALTFTLSSSETNTNTDVKTNTNTDVKTNTNTDVKPDSLKLEFKTIYFDALYEYITQQMEKIVTANYLYTTDIGQQIASGNIQSKTAKIKEFIPLINWTNYINIAENSVNATQIADNHSKLITTLQTNDKALEDAVSNYIDPNNQVLQDYCKTFKNLLNYTIAIDINQIDILYRAKAIESGLEISNNHMRMIPNCADLLYNGNYNEIKSILHKHLSDNKTA